MCLCKKPCVCACVCVCVPVEMRKISTMHEQCDATPPMYPSPKMGQMHEQEMKSLHLVVGNGIRKHWPFVGSLRPQCESHDSQIFTVPPVTGLVKSQHTSPKPSRPQAGLQPHRQMQRCFFPLLAWVSCNPKQHGTARADVRVCTVRTCVWLRLHVREGKRVRHITGDTDCLQDQYISGQFILWMRVWRAFIPRRLHEAYNKKTSSRHRENKVSVRGNFFPSRWLTCKIRETIMEWSN